MGRVTMRKRLTAKPGSQGRPPEGMHDPIRAQGNWLASVVRGYFQYHAIPGNWPALGFRHQCRGCGIKPYADAATSPASTGTACGNSLTLAPPARILHPWPEQRLAVIIQGRSRVR